MGCPRYGSRLQCVLGNATLLSVGIASFNASISSQPLAWTVGLSQAPDTDPASRQSLLGRAFFLGTPASVDFGELNPYRACALIFEGVSSSLAFPGEDQSRWARNDPIFVAPILQSITPIMTVFYSPDRRTVTNQQALKVPEIHLSCMKLVPFDAPGKVEGGRAAFHPVSMLYVALASFGILMFFC